MAHFYGDMRGNRGMVTRMGTPRSGMTAHIRGWNFGVRVVIHVDGAGRDYVRIYRTGGSNGSVTDALVTEFTDKS